MTFVYPIALVGLAVIPLIVLLYALNERRRRKSQAKFGNPALLPNVIDRSPGKLRLLPLAVLLVALAAMIIGVARPHATVSVPREEATVILAIDTSRSMKATDIQPTRLDAAKNVAKTFLTEVPEKFQIGVVGFSTRAAVGVPPTQDRALVEAALDALAPGEGTALGDAIALGIRVGQPPPEPDGTVPPRSILMISDGFRDGGRVEPAAAAEEARAMGIPVYTVLVGTPNGVVEEELTGGFRRIIRVPPSPETLQQVSTATGGEFFAALDVETCARSTRSSAPAWGSARRSARSPTYSRPALRLFCSSAAPSRHSCSGECRETRRSRIARPGRGGRAHARGERGRGARVRRAPGLRAGRRAVGRRARQQRQLASGHELAAHLPAPPRRRRASTRSSAAGRSTSRSWGCSGAPSIPGSPPGAPSRSSARGSARRLSRRASSPYIGCMPSAGGGPRIPTAASAFPPGQPTTYRTRTVRVRSGSATVRSRCRAGERLVGAGHAFGFQTRTPPSESLAAGVTGTRAVQGGQVVVRVRGDAEIDEVRALVQVQAVCART